MKSSIRFARSILVIVSFTLLMLSGGCGGGSDSTPTSLPDDSLVTVGMNQINISLYQKGELSPLNRWYDDYHGTVTDLSTGLVWLKDAGWGGQYPLWDSTSYTNSAFARVAQVKKGNPASLTETDKNYSNWRLPTVFEFSTLYTGIEPVSYNNPRFFLNVKERYWTGSATYNDSGLLFAWIAKMDGSTAIAGYNMNDNFYVWPVHGKQ